MRIVSLSPSFTDIVSAVGRGDALCGVTNHCPEIREGITQIGSPKAIEFSVLNSLKPDLILADQNENRPEELRALRNHYRVESFDVRSVQAVFDTVSAIGRLTDAIPEAAKLNEEILRAKEAAQAAAKEFEPVQTLVLLWNTPYLTINFDTYISRLVETAGGYNVFHSEPLREFPLDLEDLIEKNPSLLLLPKDPYPFKKRHIARFREYRGFSKIPIELVDGELFSYFGPKTAEALKKLSAIISKAASDLSPLGTVPKGESPR